MTSLQKHSHWYCAFNAKKCAVLQHNPRPIKIVSLSLFQSGVVTYFCKSSGCIYDHRPATTSEARPVYFPSRGHIFHCSCALTRLKILALRSCLNGTPAYKCDYTEQLRAQVNIADPVTLVTEEADTPSQLLPLVAQESEEMSHWEGLEGTQLISLVEKLTEEASRSNAIIRIHFGEDPGILDGIHHIDPTRYIERGLVGCVASTHQGWVAPLYFKPCFCRQGAISVPAEVKTCSQAVNAFSETIDEHWKEVCQGSESWRKWWRSGRPRKLSFTARPDAHPALLEDHPPPTVAPSATAATDPPPAPPTTAPFTTALTDSHLHPSPQLVSTATTTSQGDADETSAARAGTGARLDRGTSPARTPPSATPGTTASGGNKRKKGNNKRSVRSREVSEDRRPRSHQGASQPRRQAPEKVCNYCARKGHTAVTCYARNADQRQERLFRQILAEGRYSAASLSALPTTYVHSTAPQPSPPQHPPMPNPLLSQLGAWGHSQGRQWSPPPHRYPQPGPLIVEQNPEELCTK
ncbi:hypothetical protein GWK47_002450 [Chionoecetes opilio]|uniref:Uncharacterized protein n=1 Tax=Chionoecetes opilio TaxID=41210 RepID=A0A8J5BUV9_CHIOP|nr:hypothetical protein GWK47_002450 [Chionoecetes opilio]